MERAERAAHLPSSSNHPPYSTHPTPTLACPARSRPPSSVHPGFLPLSMSPDQRPRPSLHITASTQLPSFHSFINGLENVNDPSPPQAQAPLAWQPHSPLSPTFTSDRMPTHSRGPSQTTPSYSSDYAPSLDLRGDHYIPAHPVLKEGDLISQHELSGQRATQLPPKIFFHKHEEVSRSSRGRWASSDPPQYRQSRGISLSDYVDRRVPIVGAETELDIAAPGCDQVKICLNWPGYSKVEFHRQAPLSNGKITTRGLFTEVARAVLGFITMIESRHVPVEPGGEAWKVGGEDGIQGPEIVIIGVQYEAEDRWHPILEVSQ